MSQSQIDARRRELCEQLQARLDAAYALHGTAQVFEENQRAAVDDFLAAMSRLDQVELGLVAAPSAD